jgi:hypothetical protein
VNPIVAGMLNKDDRVFIEKMRRQSLSDDAARLLVIVTKLVAALEASIRVLRELDQ